MSSRALSSNTEAAILARLMQAQQTDLSRGAAEDLLSLRFDEGDVARMNELAELARQGDLSDAERAELDSYRHVGNLLAIIQSKARRVMRQSESQPGVNARLVRELWQRAGDHCEYCHLPSDLHPLPFQIDPSKTPL